MYDYRHVAEAVIADDNARLEKILREGADPNERKHTSLPYPMEIAVAKGNEFAVERLFAYGANTDYLWQNQSLMRIALAAGNARMARQVQHETGLSATGVAQHPDQNGQTPLHRAAAAGLTDIAKFLIDEKANVLARDKQGRTALDLAREHGHDQTVQLIAPYAARAEHQKAERRRAPGPKGP